MHFDSLDNLKSQLRAENFEHRAYLDDADMAKALAYVDEDSRVNGTPEQELRYIEGFLDLPFGYLKDSKVVPAAGYEKCQCGRTPNALDVIYFAYKKHVHSKDLIRDTIIGFRNTFEIAATGRTTECFDCGRKIEIVKYRISSIYIYA